MGRSAYSPPRRALMGVGHPAAGSSLPARRGRRSPPDEYDGQWASVVSRVGCERNNRARVSRRLTHVESAPLTATMESTQTRGPQQGAALMKRTSKYVALDVHQATTSAS